MFLMIHLCVNVRRNNTIVKARERVFTGKLDKYLRKCHIYIYIAYEKKKNAEIHEMLPSWNQKRAL